jgi:hypothetical protein
MRWPWRRRRRRADYVAAGREAAVRARREQERRLHEARSDWPEVNQARDVLSAWIEAALRGGA